MRRETANGRTGERANGLRERPGVAVPRGEISHKHSATEWDVWDRWDLYGQTSRPISAVSLINLIPYGTQYTSSRRAARLHATARRPFAVSPFRPFAVSPTRPP